jgi:hypothetical protein
MKKILATAFLLFGFLTMSSQTADYITDLKTPELDETSGLLFYNNKIITHNDGGSAAHLYEIDATTGAILRTIEINNATNIDWEDIAQDDTYIYLGDIGNNFGNRKNLKIYKISKEDYDSMDDIATPEVISYSYNDQIDFTSNINNNNWDAEGLISYGDKLLIFSKNWQDKKVNVYSIPKTTGIHSAILESNYNTNGLITGADVSVDGVIYLTGYSNSEAPFMYTIHGIPANTLDVFSGTISEKISNIVPIGNQVEAIALFEISTTKHHLYISNERAPAPFSGIFPPKLWSIEIDADKVTLAVPDVTADFSLNIFPNPFDKILNLSEIVDEIVIFDFLGRSVAKQQFVKELSLENLDKGLYIAHIEIDNSKFIRKIIKK